MQIVNKTLSIVLAGGVGSRLHPLTADRAKPAVPFGGIYRIIDFTLSNCLHAGLRRILILTQYKSHSLHKHLRDGWSIFIPEIGEFITAVPAQMRMGEGWYAGTADAINQNRFLLERSGAEYVLVLAGDHIYRMDYAWMLEEHVRRKLDVTVACMPVPISEAHAFGVMEVDDDLRIRHFVEKSAAPPTMPGDSQRALASMGVYVFSLPVLLKVLAQDNGDVSSGHDFGKNILPRIINTLTVGAYGFGGKEGRVTRDGYWRDVGTLDAYYQANMDLLDPVPPIDLYQQDWGIRTYHGQYPAARMAPGSSGEVGSVVNTMLGGGDVIIGAKVIHSILSPNVWVESRTIIEDAILFEGVHVGEGARLRRCIIDKGVRIPSGETIGCDQDRDRSRGFTLSEGGIVVVPKEYQF
ncbi:MAG: glucose-1-phosphate adenylyltransferase [Nitrospirae bacterium]|nr:glucose-1-phosphate adenylyltransferase [Candidatus Manganitrophaceae bacterium]